MLQLGKMRDRFQVQSLTTTQDGYGENLPSWETLCEVWGHLENLSGRQLQLAQADTITSTPTHILHMHYLPGLLLGRNKFQLSLEDGTFRTFAINRFNDPDNEHAELHITVTEVKATA